MTVNISLNDADSVRALTVMLQTLDSSGALNDHEVMVVERIVEECYAQEPLLDPDDIDEDIEAFRERLAERLAAQDD